MDTSPPIEAVAWGEIVVTGLGRFKDAKLWPGGGRAWDWNETGTRHVPGVQVADCAELVTAGARTVVLSRGMWRALRVPAATVDWLERQGLAVHVDETRRAVARYNECAASGEPVGGLFHSTC